MVKTLLRMCDTDANRCLNKRNIYEQVHNRVRKSSSEHLLSKKAGVVSKMVGEGAMPKRLTQAGGPGDLTRGVQKRGGTFSFGIGSKSVQNRLRYKGGGGVDKKHNSYDRYLARKKGWVLRNQLC